jgi:nucleoside-triphosphatase THEP1
MVQVLLHGLDRKRLLLELIPELKLRARGFTTFEGYEAGQVAGIRLKSLDGKEGWAAHLKASGPPVGRFKVALEDLDSIAAASLRGEIFPDRIFVIDEITPVLLASAKLKTAILDAFDSGASVIATIPDKPDEFVDALRKRPGVQWLEVTPENRARQKSAVLRDLLLAK